MTTVVGLHGFTGVPSAFDCIAVPEGHRLVAPTLAGHGPRPVPASSFAAEVERLGQLVDALAGSVVLLGYSLGGRLALGLLARNPARIAGVVVIGAHLGLDAADGPGRAERMASDAVWASMLRTRGLEAFVDAWETQPLFASQRELGRLLRDFRRATRLTHEPVALASALEALSLGAMPDLRPAVRAFPRPLVFAAGARDAKFAELAREGACLAERARATIADDAGHDVLLERPDFVTNLVAEVLLECADERC